MGKQITNLSRKLETVKDNHMKLLELKNIISCIKNSLVGLTSILDTTEEKNKWHGKFEKKKKYANKE